MTVKRLQENTVQKKMPLRLIGSLHEEIFNDSKSKGESMNLVINKILKAHYLTNEESDKEKPQT